MIKKIVCLILLLLTFGLASQSLPHRLADLVKDKDWDGLAALCADASHRGVAAHFSGAAALVLGVDGDEQLTYYARFADFAEIGKLTFSLQGGRALGMEVVKGISTLSFVSDLIPHPVHNQKVESGDARITFRNGTMYQGRPMDSVFIYVGDWDFSIRPGNKEEQLTLKTQVGKDTFSVKGGVSVFIWDAESLGLKNPQSPVSLSSLPIKAQALFARFGEHWGQTVLPLDEVWFLPNQAGYQAALFVPRQGNALYRYSFSPTAIPDTNLIEFPRGAFLLYYNARQGLKLTSASGNDAQSMHLRLFFNPHNGYIAGTSDVHFKEAGDHKTFELAEGLLAKATVGDAEQPVFRLDHVFHLMGQNIQKVRVSYAGRLFDRNELEKKARIKGPGLIERATDNFIVLSRDRAFYPNPGLTFFKTRVFVSHPDNVLSLVSGELKSRRTEKGVTKSVFESDGLKDLTMVCGRFELRETVDSTIPMNLYAARDLNFSDYFRPGEIKGLFDFLLHHLPALPIKELNVLFDRGSDYGGISHPGLMHFHVVQTLIKDDSIILRRVRSDSPVVFHEINKDNFVHELSHQWWGGVISWKTYQDQWITEGLAQFSTLFYLQKSLPEKTFTKVLAEARRWVVRKSEAGPMVYGQRILNLKDDFDAFQSIIYNKGALLFMMFKEILGEEAFLDRINKLVEGYRYQNISTALIIKILSQGDLFHERFFNRWVYSRIVPHVTYEVTREGGRVKIRFRQAETDFVFPLQVFVRTAKGSSVRTVVVGETDQTVEFMVEEPVRSVTVETLFSPVLLKKF